VTTDCVVPSAIHRVLAALPASVELSPTRADRPWPSSSVSRLRACNRVRAVECRVIKAVQMGHSTMRRYPGRQPGGSSPEQYGDHRCAKDQFYDYIPLRTFAANGDVKNFALGSGWSLWWILGTQDTAARAGHPALGVGSAGCAVISRCESGGCAKRW
jgi:hypothetical protein